MMEWEKQPPRSAEEPSAGGGGIGGGVFVKVMTDEQMEVLRKQIAVYAIICEQLVELHKSLTSQNDFAGVRLGNLYCDPLITSGAPKMSGRQRWTPTPTQLQILERVFDQGVGTPSKQKIKDLTTELSQHGQISETNVYNWFQNRRARSKRKQHATTPSANNNGESEVEPEEVDSPKEKNTKLGEEFQQRPILSSRASEDQLLSVVDPNASKSREPLMPRFGGDLGQMPFYGEMDQLMGKIQVPGNYNPFMQQDDNNMEG
ncbi:hypothetical protein CASFOL_020231 [Castilleja foliolosa]|uniref:Homeobox domain-containing protein n=1 Tax=Castilleja foliolosa TaxID=1961234 RepID=A0ABD3D1J6_9LAMI